MSTLRELLKEKAHESNQRERREKRDEWVAAVKRLIGQFREWLREADPEQVLDVMTLDIEKLEQGLGTYHVPGLEISLDDTTVRVLPVGRNVVGFVGPRGDAGIRAVGRIDITDGSQKYILYRTTEGGEDRWYALDGRFEATLLDQHRFEAIMRDLLS